MVVGGDVVVDGGGGVDGAGVDGWCCDDERPIAPGATDHSLAYKCTPHRQLIHCNNLDGQQR